MNTRTLIAATIGWIGGLGLLAGALAGVSWSGIASEFGDRLPSARAAAGESVEPRLGERDFSDGVARQRLTSAGEERVGEFLATPRTVDGEQAPATTIDGHLIALNDLQLVELRFEPRATLITTSVNSIKTSTGFAKPTDAWVAVWLREGVPAPEWGGIPTTVRVFAIIEDGTGKVRSVHAGKFNPAAKDDPAPAPGSSSEEFRCTEEPSGLPGNRVCFR